jgi:hypothetical protein
MALVMINGISQDPAAQSDALNAPRRFFGISIAMRTPVDSDCSSRSCPSGIRPGESLA